MPRLSDTLLTACLSVAMPFRCPVCGKPPFDGSPGMFCAECLESLPFIAPPYCPGCGGTMDGILDVCPKCLHQPPRPWSQAFSLFDMEGNARLAVMMLKYRGRPEFARSLGRLLGPWQPGLSQPSLLQAHLLRNVLLGHQESQPRGGPPVSTCPTLSITGLGCQSVSCGAICLECHSSILALVAGPGQSSHGYPGHSCPSEGSLGWLYPRWAHALFTSVCSGLSVRHGAHFLAEMVPPSLGKGQETWIAPSSYTGLMLAFHCENVECRLLPSLENEIGRAHV